MVLTSAAIRLKSGVIVSTRISTCFFTDAIQLFVGATQFREKFSHEKILLVVAPPANVDVLTTPARERGGRGEGAAVEAAAQTEGYHTGYIKWDVQCSRNESVI